MKKTFIFIMAFFYLNTLWAMEETNQKKNLKIKLPFIKGKEYRAQLFDDVNSYHERTSTKSNIIKTEKTIVRQYRKTQPWYKKHANALVGLGGITAAYALNKNGASKTTVTPFLGLSSYYLSKPVTELCNWVLRKKKKPIDYYDKVGFYLADKVIPLGLSLLSIGIIGRTTPLNLEIINSVTSPCHQKAINSSVYWAWGILLGSPLLTIGAIENKKLFHPVIKVSLGILCSFATFAAIDEVANYCADKPYLKYACGLPLIYTGNKLIKDFIYDLLREPLKDKKKEQINLTEQFDKKRDNVPTLLYLSSQKYLENLFSDERRSIISTVKKEQIPTKCKNIIITLQQEVDKKTLKNIMENDLIYPYDLQLTTCENKGKWLRKATFFMNSVTNQDMRKYEAERVLRAEKESLTFNDAQILFDPLECHSFFDTVLPEKNRNSYLQKVLNAFWIIKLKITKNIYLQDNPSKENRPEKTIDFSKLENIVIEKYKKRRSWPEKYPVRSLLFGFTAFAATWKLCGLDAPIEG